MRIFGNILWFLICGWFLALCWFIVALFWCITIIGIPVGIQCFKFAGLMLAPFGKEIFYSASPFSFLLNLLWLIFGGVELAITSGIIGIILCFTIVGIPFGLQCFKLSQLALMPFGARATTVKVF